MRQALEKLKKLEQRFKTKEMRVKSVSSFDAKMSRSFQVAPNPNYTHKPLHKFSK